MPRKPFLMACLIVSCGAAVASCGTLRASRPPCRGLEGPA
jgi:hypothetical protein